MMRIRAIRGSGNVPSSRTERLDSHPLRTDPTPMAALTTTIDIEHGECLLEVFHLGFAESVWRHDFDRYVWSFEHKKQTELPRRSPRRPTVSLSLVCRAASSYRSLRRNT